MSVNNSPIKSPTKGSKAKWGPMSPRKMVKSIGSHLSPKKKSPRKKSVLSPCIDEGAPVSNVAVPVYEYLDDDDAAIMKSPPPKSESELQAEALLEKMRKDRDEQLANEKEIEKQIAQCQERHAVSMMMAPEDVDECVEQIARLKREYEKIQSAVSILDMHLLNLECDLEDARSEAMGILADHESYVDDPSESHVNVDFSEHEHYRTEMVEILSPGRKTTVEWPSRGDDSFSLHYLRIYIYI